MDGYGVARSGFEPNLELYRGLVAEYCGGIRDCEIVGRLRRRSLDMRNVVRGEVLGDGRTVDISRKESCEK